MDVPFLVNHSKDVTHIDELAHDCDALRRELYIQALLATLSHFLRFSGSFSLTSAEKSASTLSL
jgi:hypothetical protein